MHRLVAAAGLALVLSVSACGTTVPLTQSISTTSGTDSGLGVGQAPDGSSTPAYQPLAPGAQPTRAGGGDAATSTGGGSSGQPVPGTTGGSLPTLAPGANGRGVTDTSITLGLAVPSGEAALGNAFGVSGASTASPQDVVDVLVKEVNKAGGVLGRKLVVYVHSFDATAAIANPSQTVAEICADFRDDHKAFAVLVAVVDPGLRKCLAEMGSPLLVLGGGIASVIPQAAYAEHGGRFLFGPNAITTERLGSLYVQSLLDRSFAQRWNTAAGGPGVEPVKLGLIHVDAPDTNALYAQVTKELARRGLRFTDTVVYAQDASAALAATQNAVLKFRRDGITHVFGASVFFLRDAENQRYRPRYAYLPGLGKLGTDNAPAAQLNGAQTVGWVPTTDVAAAQDPGDSPAAAHCRGVMKAAGLNTADRAGLGTMYALCDAVYAFRAALTAGSSPSLSGLHRGYESLGTRFPTALTFAASLGPNRHHGVDAVRDMAWDAECGCLVYANRRNRA